MNNQCKIPVRMRSLPAKVERHTPDDGTAPNANDGLAFGAVHERLVIAITKDGETLSATVGGAFLEALAEILADAFQQVATARDLRSRGSLQ